MGRGWEGGRTLRLERRVFSAREVKKGAGCSCLKALGTRGSLVRSRHAHFV